MMKNRSFSAVLVLTAIAGALVGCQATGAYASEFPSKEIQVIVGAAAGGLVAVFYGLFYHLIPRLLMRRGLFADRELVVLLAIILVSRATGQLFEKLGLLAVRSSRSRSIASLGRRLMASMTMWVSSRYFSTAQAVSEGFAFGPMLRGALGHEVVGRPRDVQEELVPGVAHRRGDAVHPAGAHLHLLHAFGQAVFVVPDFLGGSQVVKEQ